MHIVYEGEHANCDQDGRAYDAAILILGGGSSPQEQPPAQHDQEHRPDPIYLEKPDTQVMEEKKNAQTYEDHGSGGHAPGEIVPLPGAEHRSQAKGIRRRLTNLNGLG